MSSRKHRGRGKLVRMTDFFPLPRRYQSKDSADDTASSPHVSFQERSSVSRGTSKHHSGHKSGGNSQSSSSTSSPAKHRQKMHDPSDPTAEVSGFNSSFDDARELQDSISEYPTLNQTVLDTALKDMLVPLRSTLHTDIMTLTQKFKSELTAVSDRVTHVESKKRKFASTINEMVNAHNERDDEMLWMKAKLADLEDR